MASTKIAVKTQYLNSAATKIDGYKEDFKTSYEKVYQIADDIFSNNNWLGADARAFMTQLTGFKNDFEDLYMKMNDYRMFLEKAARAYESSQDVTTKRANSLESDR